MDERIWPKRYQQWTASRREQQRELQRMKELEDIAPPQEVMKIIASQTSPGTAHTLSVLYPEVSYPTSLEEITEYSQEFIKAVNSGDYESVRSYLDAGFPIGNAEFLQNKFDVLNGGKRTPSRRMGMELPVLLQEKYLFPIIILVLRGMKFNKESLENIFHPNSFWTGNAIEEIMEYSSEEYLHDYIEILAVEDIEKIRQLQIFSNFFTIDNVNLHLFLTKKVLAFSSTFQVYEKRNISLILIREANFFEGIQKNFKVRSILERIYEILAYLKQHFKHRTLIENFFGFTQSLANISVVEQHLQEIYNKMFRE